VGPETGELLQRIARHREAKRKENARRDMVRSLVHAYGLPSPQPLVAKVMDGLAQAGVFGPGAVLVGDAAYQTYPAMLGTRLRGAFARAHKAEGAEFLTVSIVVQDERTEFFKETLQAIDPTFRQIPLRRNATAQFLSQNRLRVDFLPPTPPSLEAGAEPLCLLDFLIHEPVKAVLLHGSGIAVTVPGPERFAIHQLMASRRKATQASANNHALLQFLASKRPEALKRVWAEALQRGPTWQKLLLLSVHQLPAPVQENLTDAGLISRQRARAPVTRPKLRRS
jgi:hypothetical protein